MPARAAGRAPSDRLTCLKADATDLPDADGARASVVSAQVAEYPPDIDGFAAAALRVTGPGGRALVLATGRAALVWHSDAPGRMARALGALEDHCVDPRLPLRLGSILRRAGFEVTRVSAFPMVVREIAVPNDAAGLMRLVRGYLERTGAVPAGQLAAWAEEQVAPGAAGRFSFAPAGSASRSGDRNEPPAGAGQGGRPAGHSS